MIMRRGEHWFCSNSRCACEVTVAKEGPLDGGPPRCMCGAVMKRRYRSPVFQYLDFLRPEEERLAIHVKEKE